MATKNKVVKKKASFKTVKEGKGQFKETSGELEQLHAESMKAEDVHRVGVSMGLTRNIENYESTKMTVWVDYPCKEEDIETSFKNARAFCELKLQEFSNEVDADLGRA